ncbi:MAG: prenyltransferase/squalene oxidase repeat-containing protein [Verrucomicrobiota bacterium]|nr:prenyltransferase/squalene oxidase repeat-containing protein [Verrucomicrobiota bacterium]
MSCIGTSLNSIRGRMLDAARLAPKLLGESSRAVMQFLMTRMNAEGGFRGRSATSDLYYTVFALDALEALGAQPHGELVRRYLEEFGDGRGLDFVHCCCLARCWAAIGRSDADGRRDAILSRIESHRTPDGGYGTGIGGGEGNPYGCFLALSAYEDLGRRVPNELGVVGFLGRSMMSDGSWSNARNAGDAGPDDANCKGSTTATGAAVVVLNRLVSTAPEENQAAGLFDPGLTARWLLDRMDAGGGFLAAPGTPAPDLLSTAVAVHALGILGVQLGFLRDALLDFVDSLWDGRGAFRGYWGDDQGDSEYTFYGLLVLGHLARLH